jgi:formylglycine-generating enzyme required for sulfatase activity
MNRHLLLGGLAVCAFAPTYLLTILSRQSPQREPADTLPAMVSIPGCEITMGTDFKLGWADEEPAHRVRVDAFWMDETDVINAQLRTVYTLWGGTAPLHSGHD